MSRSPEVLIARLRNRKGRIVAYSVLVLGCLVVLAVDCCVLIQAYAQLIPREDGDPTLHAVMSQQIVIAISSMQAMGIFWAAMLGAAIALLIGEIMTFTKNDLLVDLWDRVQTLEARGTRSARSQEPQGRPEEP